MQSLTVKLHLGTEYTEPKWEKSIRGKIQSGLWLGNTRSILVDSEMQLWHSLPSHPLPPLMIYFPKKILLCLAAQ